MAHHQHGDGRTSDRPGLLKMLRLSSNTPTVVPLGEEEMAESIDEPPDDILSPLPSADQFLQDHKHARVGTKPVHDRRESLLTRAIRANSNPPLLSPISPTILRGLSTTSSHSTASTAELTSDDHSTPPHSATPSPPLMHSSLVPMLSGTKVALPIIPAPIIEQQPAVPPQTSTGEAAIEKSLGRKRCIMFACGAEKKKEPEPVKVVETPAPAPKRKCMLTFMCPSRNDKKQDLAAEVLDAKSGSDSQARKFSTDSGISASDRDLAPFPKLDEAKAPIATPAKIRTVQSFHEFGSSMDEADAWVEKPIDQGRRLTLTDCLRKEMAIRQLGEEAEAEADAEAAEEQDDNEDDDENAEDDFAPSDNSSDDGNESDDEEGFADSDEESNADSDDLFWTTTAQTSMTNISQLQSLSRNRSAASSIESSTNLSRFNTRSTGRHSTRRFRPKAPKMGPATPELPDSTDFVCGTLDEDRPLEAAYIACREARKREKHIAIPQDIDPSFPTSDPEDSDDDEEEGAYESGMGGNFRTPNHRSRRESNVKSSVPLSPMQKSRSPLSPQNAGKRRVLRSPPPPLARRGTARSPAPPRRLFGFSPSRLRSPPPSARLRSPRGSPTVAGLPLGITINRLAQRPGLGRTASLPHTPNPFFRNWQLKRTDSNLESQDITPGVTSETLRPDMHVRGPVDIVIGLEKKRQKRKEKFWRQHCRKAAKEAAERKPVAGRGAERMKELGLGCAERARQYGLQTQETPAAVISM